MHTNTLYGIARQAGPLPACTRLFSKPERTSASWVMTVDHVCEEGEIVTSYGNGRQEHVVTYAKTATPANCAGTQAVMEAIEASAKTGKAA